MWNKRLFLLGIRLAVAWIFIAFCWDKILHPNAFAESIFRYRVLPDLMINVLALILPWMELWCALALFVPQLRLAAWNWMVVMLVVFTLAKGSAFVRGLDISCGCHGSGGEGEIIGWSSIVFNLLILAGCVVAKYSEGRGSGGC